MLDRLPRPTFRRAPSAPSMSLVLAVYDPPIDALQEQLDAVAAQSSSDWECIAVDDASTDPNVAAVLARWASIDPDRRRVITREKNGGIAAASNDGLDAAHGEFVGFIDHDDVLHEEAVAAVIAHFAQHREHGVVHTDEQTVDARGAVIAAYHKPDWSPRRHLGHHYLAHFVAARRSVIGGLRVMAEFEPSQDYDFYLRVIEAAERMGLTVGHIPRILYSWRAIAGSSARDASEKPEMVEAVRRCVAAALERRGDEARAELVEYRGAPTTSCRLVRSVPDVSFAAVPISTGTLPAEVNTAIAESDAEVICLVDDPGVQDADWAGQLIALSSVAGVGVAGPKIVDADTDTLLSSGRVVQPRLEDQFVGEPADSSGPWGSLFVEREVSAIAPLGLTVRRALFEQVGPLAEDVDLDAAVAEFCARVIASDHDVVWTPHVTLSVSASFGPGAGLFDPDRADERERDDAIVAARSPEPRRERFDPFGVGQHDGRHENAHTYARRLLHAGEVDLVTSDVFDTLVTRPVATPSDLFLRLAESPDVSGTVSPNVFAHARRDAEFRARRDRADGRRRQMRADGHDDIAIAKDPDVAAPEVGMHEIYERMPASFGNLEALRERELELEGRTLVPIPETVAVFELAHQLGIPVVLVSDIYLTSEELTAVLSSAGLDLSLVDEVVTSLDHRRGKAHGLLDETIARRRVQPERVVHLGDNEIADVRTAERLGARVAHLDVPKRDHAVELVPEPLRNWSSASGTDLGISASVRATLVATRSGTDPSYQFGVATIGPALAGFGRWVSDTATDLGGSHVHCMLREGATIAELMRVVAPDGPTPVPLHVSRWVTMRAAVIDGSREQLLTSLSRRADLTAQHVVDAFGCELELVREVIGGDTVPAAEVDDACAALAAHDDARTAIIDGAAALRARVLTYLADRLEADDGPIVLSDVGWGGTIQEGLTRILRSGGDDRDVVGLYFAMSSAGEERVARGASMRSYLPNRFADPDAARDSRAVAHHADTIERIMTPAIGTLLDIDAAGAPITRSADHDHLPPSLVSAQRGMRDVVDTLADEDRGVTDFDDRRWHDPQLRAAFAATIARVVVAPDHRVASALGSWPHDDVAGTDHRAIADPRVAEAIPYANVHDVAQLDPNGRRWVSGLAGSRNRALVGQLDARHRMVDVDDLAPVGDLGVALLAAFEVGDNQARIQHAGPARQLPGGWTMLRLDGEVDSLRGLRFDAGEHTSFVDVDVFEVRLGTDDPGEIPRRSIRFDDSDVRIIGGHHFDGRSFVHRAGGHVLLDFDPDVAGRIRRIQVTVGFRAIRLADDSPLAITPIATRTKDQARRVAGAVRRRL